MSIEAMKQALETLEQHGTPLLNHEDAYAASLTSLRQAIAEVEKQEPVAWLQLTAYGNKLLSFNKPSDKEVHCYTGIKLHDPKNIPLYTHLPKRKLQ